MTLRKKYELKEEITTSEIMMMLRAYFGEKYEIYETALIGADFIIKKSALEGLACKIKARENRKSISFWRMVPSFWGRYFFGGIMEFIKGKQMMEELAEFFENTKSIRY